MSKGKKVLTAIYFILVAVVIYFVVTGAIAANAQDFLESRKDEIIAGGLESDFELIGAVTVAQTSNQRQALIYKNPVVYETNAFANISLINYISFNENIAVNHLAIILRDVFIVYEGSERLPIDVLRMRVDFDNSVPIGGGNTSMSVTTSLAPIFDEYAGYISMNLDAIKHQGGFPGIRRLIFLLAISPTETATLFELTPEMLYEINNRDLYLTNTYNQSNFNEAISAGIFYFNPYFGEVFASFNPLWWYLLITILGFLIITYFIYFHRHVWAKTSRSRQIKKAHKQAVYEQTKKEYEQSKIISDKTKEEEKQ